VSWIETTLGKSFELYQPQTITTKELIEDGEYQVYGANGVIGRYNKYNHVEQQLLLTCRGATCGAVNVSSPYAWINGNAMVVKPKERDIDIRFAEYFFRGAVDLKKAITGAAQPQITRQSLSTVPFKYPPLSTQQKIVAKLDAIFAEIDKATAAAEANAKNAEDLLISIISQLFNELKGSYKLIKLGDVCSRVEYGSSSKSESTGKVPVLRMGNIINGKLDFSDLVFTNDDNEIYKYQLSYGDVLFNRTNSPLHVGKSAVFQSFEKIIFAGYLIRIQCDKNIVLPEFLGYFLNSKEIREYGYSVMSHSINQANINGSKLKEYPFLLPPIDTQKSIVNSIITIENHCINLVEKYSKKINDFFVLRQSILKQAFAGELVRE